MILPANRSLLGLGCLVLMSALFGLSAVASASPLPEPAGMFRYQLTVMGAVGGEAVLTIGSPSKVGDDSVRHIRLEARTAGVAGRIYDAQGDGTTVIDSALNPLRMKWSSKTRGKPREANIVFHARGVKGTYRFTSKPARKLRLKSKSWPMDAISAYLWLPQQSLEVGAEYRRSFFDGRRLGTLKATVGSPSSIQVPVGLREVVPMQIVADRAGKKREVVFWIGRHDRVLYRTELAHGILGKGRADLTGIQRPDGP